MKHILNEMSEEEKNSIRSQHTGSLQVQTERFKALVENKLGNAKPLISEDEELGLDEEHDEEDDGINYPKMNLRKQFGKGRHLVPHYSDEEWNGFLDSFDDEDSEVYRRDAWREKLKNGDTHPFDKFGNLTDDE
jgi:hypothetical protein